MNDHADLPPDATDADVARRRLGLGAETASMARMRAAPKPRHLARRRRVLRTSKFGLPALALLLLGAIAVWPEINRTLSLSKDAAREVAAVRRDSGKMMSPHYSGIDSHDRPYTVTAASGRQVGPSRIDLDAPVMDMTTTSGWVLLRADRGTYMQDSNMLDLAGHVTLYRDDGILAHSPIATVDVKSGVISSADWIHADGPFGILDAQGYMLAQNAGTAQFTGPARLVLNDDHLARGPDAPDGTAAGAAIGAAAGGGAHNPTQTTAKVHGSAAHARHRRTGPHRR